MQVRYQLRYSPDFLASADLTAFAAVSLRP